VTAENLAAPAPARDADPEGPRGANVREVELSVTGMTCAACAARVEKKLGKLDGVHATVNYATGTALVSAPAGLPVRVLTQAVAQAGYAAAERGGPDSADVAAAGGRDAGGEFADLRRRLIVALIFFLPLTDLSLMLSLLPSLRFAGWQWLLVGCAAPVALWCAWPFHRAALRNARNGTSSMDTLVSLGIVAASGWSAYAMFGLDGGQRSATLWQQLTRGSGGGIYLETVATVTTFLLAGRLYEARARRIAGAAMRGLTATAAKDVCVLGPGGSEQRLPVSQLRPGDLFVVRPGETIAADGVVQFGQSAVDRSTMTGESVPADAAVGDDVTGGTVALTGRLVVRADKTGAETQLSQLIRLVERAQAQKAGIQRAADRICGVFVPSVLTCAALTLAGWLLAGAPAGRSRRRRPRAGPRVRHRRRDRRGGPDPPPRRPAGRPRRDRARPRDLPGHPPQPGLGVRLQRRCPAPRRARLPQPGHRVGSDDIVLGLRRSEQPAAAAGQHENF